MNEFGGCAKVGKSLRTALSALMGKFTDPQVTGRLTSIMKKINLEDGTEARGYRKVEVSTQKIICLDLNLTKPFYLRHFQCSYDIEPDAGRTSSRFYRAAFNPADLITAHQDQPISD